MPIKFSPGIISQQSGKTQQPITGQLEIQKPPDKFYLTSAPLGLPLGKQLGSSVLIQVPWVSHSCFLGYKHLTRQQVNIYIPPRIARFAR